MDLSNRTHWIFDLDGTLTVAIHDFDAIRSELGLPEGKPILEQLEGLSAEDAAARNAILDDIEIKLAERAQPQVGAPELLAQLAARNTTLGILTRNSRPNAIATLTACGLEGYFDPGFIVGREMCRPKPDPEGILRLLEAWKAGPETAVMVGDYRFDLMAGRSAGTATVYLDPEGTFLFRDLADVSIHALSELVRPTG